MNAHSEIMTKLKLPDGILIDGTFQPAASGATFETKNPFDGEVIAALPSCGQADVDAAVASAKAAFESGVWSGLHPSERKAVLHKLADLIMDNVEELAAMEALENGAAAVASMRRDYKRRRDYIVREFNDMGLPCHMPGGAFYVFPDIRSTGLSSRDFASGLLESENVAAVPGDAFGASGEGFLRCCYATDLDLIKRALEGFRQFLASLKG